MKPERPLTFDWHAHDRSLIRMGLAMLVTLGAFIGMFIIFRVVTPESRPVDVRPQRVLLLNPDVPAERALIHQAMDRSFGILPSDPVLAGQPKEMQMPVFTPGYTGHELRLKPLPSGLSASTRFRPFALDMDLLPPLPSPAPVRSSPPPPQVLQAIVRGPAASRAPRPRPIPDIPLADSLRPSFQVAIGPMGRVLMALPITASDDPAIHQKLHHVIMQMHFEPAQEAVQWAQITFGWQAREGTSP